MNKEISYFKKALVMLMAVMMVFTMMPSMAWADDTNNETASSSEAGKIVASGTDGNIAWSLDSEGTLTISKANTEAENDGSMKNYPYWEEGSPWIDNTDNIRKIIVQEGITTIGQDAFADCINLQSVQLPSGLTQIGLSAFSCCESLRTIQLPEQLESIKNNAFSYCTSLYSISIPDSVTSLGNQAFADCKELKSVRFGKGLAEMQNGIGNIIFSECTKIEELILPKEITSYPSLWGSGYGKIALICYTGTEEEWNAIKFEGRKDTEAMKDAFVVYNYKEGTSGTQANIIMHPQGADYVQGDEATALTVEITDATADTEYHFQWYKNSADSTENATAVWGSSSSGNSSSYVPETGKDNKGDTYYFCRVYSVKDGALAETDSNRVKVSVEAVSPKFDGKGSEADPWLIQSADDITILRRLVNGGESMKNKFFKLTADVTLPTDWIPMGRTKNGSKDIGEGSNLNAFAGTLDGNGHKVTVPKGGKPLFGYVNGATVKNLNIYGEEIDGYGLIDNFEGVGLSGSAVIIDNVKILSGTKIKKSGFLGGNITTNPFAGNSAGFEATIRNCTIEKGVTIGYCKDERMIGSFAGRMQGTIENCISEADVYGTDYVGGIIGTRDNAMGACAVKNCRFSGTVTGTGRNTGGIIGGGYENKTAPNGIKISAIGCTVDGTVKGNINVGGILGGDEFVAQAWNAYTLAGNTFSGKIKGEENVGGIIGFYDSLNKMDNIAGNFFTKNCGVKEGIGAVKYVDTNYKNPTDIKGTTYFNTAKGISNCPTVEGCDWKANYNRTDDPLGADKEKLAKAVDTIPTDAFCYELVLKSGTPETKYYIGDEFSFADAVFTAKMTDGTEKNIDTKEITVSGYNKNSHSVQTVILSYGYAQYELQVAVLKKSSGGDTKETIKVSFTLLGDDSHNEDEAVHTLSKNNLKTWITKETYTLDINATAGDLFKEALKKHNVSWKGTDDNEYNTLYISGVANPDTKKILSELDNGPYSGWMYTINGKHPEVGIDARFLNDGDEMIFHYTDDYTKEEGSDKWNTPGGEVIEEAKDVTTDTKTGTTTAPTEVKVTEKANADGTKTKVAEVKVSADNQKEILKQAKANKSKEIILSVATKAVGDATKADVTLDKSFIDSIVKDTDAKLTVKTPFGDKTYTQDELKALSAAATGTTVTTAVEKAAEEPTVDVKALTAKLTPVARSAKTAKKNVKVTVSLDKQDKEILSQLKEAGYTVKYRFYRSTKRSAGYKSTVTKKTATYTNTSGKKGTKYFYKVQVRVYDANGKLVAKTALKQCKYASRTWSR